MSIPFWPLWRGQREWSQRWWVHWFETLTYVLPLFAGTLAPCCVDTAWLVWCFRAQLRLASVVAHAFNSMWRGVSFGCDPPPFGWFRVAPRSRPYSFGMIVCVASDRRAHLCTHFFARRLSARVHTYSLLWLARRSRGSCSRWGARLDALDAVLDSLRVIARACTSFNLHRYMCE